MCDFLAMFSRQPAPLHPGLYVLSRHCDLAQTSIDGEGVSVAGGFQEVVLVASFPLSDADGRPLAEGEVIAISAGQVRASRRP